MPPRPARVPGIAAGVELGRHGVLVTLRESGRVLATAEREYASPPPQPRRSLSEVWAITALAFAALDAQLLTHVEALSLTDARRTLIGIDPLSGRTTDVYADDGSGILAEPAGLEDELLPWGVQVTGRPPFPLSALPERVAHPDRSSVWTSLPDAVTWHATGELWLSAAMARRLGVLAPDGRDLARDLLTALGIDPASLAPLAPGGARLGMLMPDPAAQLGLPVAVPVLAAPDDRSSSPVGALSAQPGRRT